MSQGFIQIGNLFLALLSAAGSVCCDWRACVRPPGPLVRVPLQSIVRSSVVHSLVDARAGPIVQHIVQYCAVQELSITRFPITSSPHLIELERCYPVV